MKEYLNGGYAGLRLERPEVDFNRRELAPVPTIAVFFFPRFLHVAFYGGWLTTMYRKKNVLLNKSRPHQQLLFLLLICNHFLVVEAS